MTQFQSHFSVLSIYSISTSLEIQWVRFSASSAKGVSFISGWRTKIPHATWNSQKKVVGGGGVYILSIYHVSAFQIPKICVVFLFLFNVLS